MIFDHSYECAIFDIVCNIQRSHKVSQMKLDVCVARNSTQKFTVIIETKQCVKIYDYGVKCAIAHNAKWRTP